MSHIRILVVDDSAVIRKLLCDALSTDPELEVVATAADGRLALSKAASLHPDVVTLDIEMPVMNGLEALKELRQSRPGMPIIMFSTMTDRGASATLEALSLGASDYVTKPSNASSIESSLAAVRAELIPKIKALAARFSARVEIAPPSKTRPQLFPQLREAIEIVAIGTSTGGPNALAEVLPKIPRDFPVPIVVVQHMPPIFTRFLAERLAMRCQIHVGEGRAGAEVLPGQAWIAPGDFHMKVVRTGLYSRLELNQDLPEHSCRPAVDVLFRSVADAFGGRVLGVVMSGMGKDGVSGAQQIRIAGGEVIVQDQASSVVWGMPGLVHGAGYANGIYALEALAAEIIRRVSESRSQSVLPARSFAVSATPSTS